MELALLGGTGEVGEALALRIGRDTDFRLRIGSRDESKATAAAETYCRELARHGVDRPMAAETNELAAEGADVAVLAVPPYHVTDTLASVAPALSEGTVLVSPAVGMADDDGRLRYNPPEAGSVTELVAAVAPADVPVVGAFTNVPARRLADLSDPIDVDTLLVGDHAEAKAVVADVVSELRGIRALEAGPLAAASTVESLTPFLIDLGRRNDGLTDLGVKFV